MSQSWLDRFDSTAFSAEHWYCPVKITKTIQKKTGKMCVHIQETGNKNSKNNIILQTYLNALKQVSTFNKPLWTVYSKTDFNIFIGLQVIRRGTLLKNPHFREEFILHAIPEAEFLDKAKTKSLKRFPPCYSQSPLQLCLEISISSNSRNLLSISSNSRNLLLISKVQLLYTVKEKGGRPDSNHPPLPMV